MWEWDNNIGDFQECETNLRVLSPKLGNIFLSNCIWCFIAFFLKHLKLYITHPSVFFQSTNKNWNNKNHVNIQFHYDGNSLSLTKKLSKIWDWLFFDTISRKRQKVCVSRKDKTTYKEWGRVYIKISKYISTLISLKLAWMLRLICCGADEMVKCYSSKKAH